VAQFFLKQAGFEVYLPLVRWRTSRARATRVSPLFPGYCFIRIELQWHSVRQCPGVIRIIKSANAEPTHVPDEVIAAIRSRERNGFVELPKRKLRDGDRVQIVSGLLAGRRGRYAGESRRHIKVLLQLLGTERQVQLSADAVEQI
jgi:transcription antitermination factor NusG